MVDSGCIQLGEDHPLRPTHELATLSSYLGTSVTMTNPMARTSSARCTANTRSKLDARGSVVGASTISGRLTSRHVPMGTARQRPVDCGPIDSMARNHSFNLHGGPAAELCIEPRAVTSGEHPAAGAWAADCVCAVICHAPSPGRRMSSHLRSEGSSTEGSRSRPRARARSSTFDRMQHTRPCMQFCLKDQSVTSMDLRLCFEVRSSQTPAEAPENRCRERIEFPRPYDQWEPDRAASIKPSG